MVRTPCPPSGSAHGTGQCIRLLRYTENPFYRAHRLLYDSLHTFYRMHKFLKLTKLEFHSGLIWIQTVFANVNRERKGEHILSGNQSASTDRQGEREREREMCVFFLNFVIF